MRHENLVVLKSALTMTEAEGLKRLLYQHGIACVVGGVLRARAPQLPTMDIQIRVPILSLAEARLLIDNPRMPAEAVTTVTRITRTTVDLLEDSVESRPLQPGIGSETSPIDPTQN